LINQARNLAGGKLLKLNKMKTIKIENGEIRIGYEFKDLSKEIQNKVLWDQANFEVDIMDKNSPYIEDAEEMERMRTPWFLTETIRFDREIELIETIEVNQYLFDEDGEMLPICYHMKNNEVNYIMYNSKHKCEIV
jgi:hypothetical protein